MVRRYSATRIYTLVSPPLHNGIIEVDDDGSILGITDTRGIPEEMERMEHHSGTIIPGFVTIQTDRVFLSKHDQDSGCPKQKTGWENRLSNRVWLHIQNIENLLCLLDVDFSAKDIEYLTTVDEPGHLFLVTAPDPGRYIRQVWPVVSLLRDRGIRICLGTDSRAAGTPSSVLNDLISLQQNFPFLETGELLTWACRNGALALGLDETLGSLEVGKRPGLVLLKGMGFATGRLTQSSKAIQLL